MERGSIVTEYFRLRQYLSRANKFSGTNAEIGFMIEEVKLLEYVLFAILSGSKESHKIAIAERTESRIWERTGYTIFQNLETFCSQFLNDFESRFGRRTRKLSHEQIQLLSNEVAGQLKMLLLKNSYEP